MSIAEDVLAGNRYALSRVLTLIENDAPEGQEALRALFPHTGRAHLIGVTGAPGTGKSSLVNRMAYYYRHPPEGEPKRVAVVAVDPSSPFTGGAILGDRIRMRDLAGDPGVFIRSMASRGALGGLARTTAGVVQALDAAGFDIIFIETVGAGQAEVDIARLAHTTLVVEAPGLGDDVQAIKAGILEIADILVVNKADRPGAMATLRALTEMLKLAHPSQETIMHHGQRMTVATGVRKTDAPLWVPPVVKTVAIDNQGMDTLAQAIARHRAHLEETGEWQVRDRVRLQTELENMLREALMQRWRSHVAEETYRRILEAVFTRRLAPTDAVAQLLAADTNGPEGQAI